MVGVVSADMGVPSPPDRREPAGRRPEGRAMRLRVWGLAVNFLANVAALWGISSIVRTGSGWPWAVGGGAVTLLCVLALAIPDKREPGDEDQA